MGILSPSEIFTRHGDKIILKVSILSPFKKHVNGDLVPIRNIYYSWGQDEFKLYIMSPLKKHHKRDLVPIRKDNFQSFYLVPIKKKQGNEDLVPLRSIY